MGRKLVKHGDATLMVSLPSKWLRANNLGKGDEIEMLEERSQIILFPAKQTERNKATIDVSGFGPLVNRLLISFYVLGLDEIEIKFSDLEEVRDFQKRVSNELIGFEIIKQTNTSFLMKDITGVESQDIDTLVKRIFFVLDSMFEELVMAMESGEGFDNVVQSDVSVNKFQHFCLRVLNKIGYKSPKKDAYLFSLISSLEEIGDLLKKIAKDSKNIKPTKEQISCVKELRQFLFMCSNLLVKYEKENAVKFANFYENIKSKIKKMKTKSFVDFFLYDVNETIVRMNNSLMLMSI